MAITQAEINGVTLVENSKNAKLGPNVWATYVSQTTCPLSCPFRGNGCYAEAGHMRFVTTRLNRAAVTSLEATVNEADKIRAVGSWGHGRLHVVGDATTDEQARILADAVAYYQTRWVNKGKPAPNVWTYTHGHDTKRESWGTISVLRSCETVTQAVKAMDDGFAAAIVIDYATDAPFAHPDDPSVTVIPCREQTGAAKDCASCRLCMRDDILLRKRAVIGFKPHGTSKARCMKVIAQAS